MSKPRIHNHTLEVETQNDGVELTLSMRTWQLFDVIFGVWFLVWVIMLVVSFNLLFSGDRFLFNLTGFLFLALVCPLLMSLDWGSALTKQVRTLDIGLLPYFVWKRFGDQTLILKGDQVEWQVRIKSKIFHSETIEVSEGGSVTLIEGRVEPFPSGWFRREPSCVAIHSANNKLEAFWGIQAEQATQTIQILNDRLKKSAA